MNINLFKLYKYFLEFKNRLILIIISWTFTTLASYLNKEVLLFKFIEPCVKDVKNNNFFYFISTDLIEIFAIYLKISFFISFHITAIFGIFHIILFFMPGLRITERYRITIVYIIYVFFWIFTTFLYSKFILPKVWFFFTNFQKNDIYSIKLYYEAKILNYIDLFIEMYTLFNICVQFFIFLFFLFDYFYHKKQFKNSRKYFYVFFVVIATCATPPDFFSQLMVFASLFVMFEIVVVLVIFINKII